MIVMMNKNNVKNNSGAHFTCSFLKQLILHLGKILIPNNVLYEHNNAQYLDILLIADNELNHSGTPIFTHDNNHFAYQDFIVLLSR